MHPCFNPDAKKKLLNSVEFIHYRNQMIIGLVFYGIFLLLYWSRFSAIGSEGIVLILLILTVCFGPLIGYYIWCIARTLRRTDAYTFHRVTLSCPHQNFWLRTMYFTVVIEDPEGGRFTADTNAIFLTHGVMSPLLEDYVNQTVTVAYNEETENIVVIG